MSFESPKKIVIVGGGFAGINLAQNMCHDKNYQITLIDSNNYNFFPPLLYQVATGFLAPSDISYPFRKLFRSERIRFRMGKVLRIDTDRHVCILDNGEVSYDFLVIASGAKTNFFGNKEIEERSVPMKTVEDALKMRNILFNHIEQATIAETPEERKKLLTIVVAGAGATGVEVSGMLAEMKNYIYKKDYPELSSSEASIYLVDGLGKVLGPMSTKTHAEAQKILENLGVQVVLNTLVSSYDGELVKLSNGTEIPTKILIWASGITANTFEGIPETSLGRAKRIITNSFHEVDGLKDVYAIGDIALMAHEEVYPNGHPQQAQPAIQQGIHLAKNFKAIARGKELTVFNYYDKGDMAVIGRNHAVVDLFKGRLHISGFLALFAWLFIHLISLVNYRNKLKTLYNWAGAYISRDQALRLIFRR